MTYSLELSSRVRTKKIVLQLAVVPSRFLLLIFLIVILLFRFLQLYTKHRSNITKISHIFNFDKYIYIYICIYMHIYILVV